MSDAGQTRTHTALFYTIVGRIFQIAIGLGTLKVQTLYLSKEQMGEYGLFLNIATLLVFVTFRPLNQYFNRRLHEWFENGNLSPALKRLIGIQFVLGLLSVPVIAVGAGLMSIHATSPIYAWAVVWACWYFFNSVFNTVVPAFNLLGYKQQWVAHNSLGLMFCLVLAWVAVLFKPNALNWTAALTLGFMLSSVIATRGLFRVARKFPHPSKRLDKVISLDFLIPATIAIGGTWIQFQSFRLFAADFMSLGEYGLFTAGYGLAAGVMAAFEGLAAQYLLPFFYASLGSRADNAFMGKQWSIFAGIMMTLTSATCLVAIAYGPLMCRLLLSNAFRDAWPYFFAGIFMEGVRVISGTTALGTHITMQVQRSLRSYLVGLVALAGGIALGKLFGSLAIFTAVLMAGCVAHLIVLSLDVSRHLRVPIAIPSLRYLIALFLVVAAFVLCAVMGFSLIMQGILMCLAAALYILLLLDVNSGFSLVK
jgi:O-antigen/teichoic acid export membrane protein